MCKWWIKEVCCCSSFYLINIIRYTYTYICVYIYSNHFTSPTVDFIISYVWKRGLKIPLYWFSAEVFSHWYAEHCSACKNKGIVFKLNRANFRAWSQEMFFLWTLANVNCIRAAIWGVTWVSVLLHIQTTSEFLFFFFFNLWNFSKCNKNKQFILFLWHALPVTEACMYQN